MKKPCSINGCEKAAVARGMCQSHYYKQWCESKTALARRPTEIVAPLPEPSPSAWIDTATSQELEYAFLLKVMKWYPPEHPLTAKEFFRRNPERKRYNPSRYEWFDGLQLRWAMLWFDEVVRMARERFSLEQWQAFSTVVHASVDVIETDSRGIADAMLRAAHKVYLYP